MKTKVNLVEVLPYIFPHFRFKKQCIKNFIAETDYDKIRQVLYNNYFHTHNK